jgi:hypothetical protein
MTSQSEVVVGEVLGRASRPTSRAYIFYDRVFDHARMTGSDVSRLLAGVIAHEVGHLLLPALSHAPSGIMRAHWDRQMVRVPDFTVDQGATIRTRLAAARAKQLTRASRFGGEGANVRTSPAARWLLASRPK